MLNNQHRHTESTRNASGLNASRLNAAHLNAAHLNTSVLERVGRREPDAFEDFMRQYQPLLAFLIRKSFGPRPAAHADFDDAMQEVSLAIWEAADKFDPARGAESTFISMVTRRRLIDRYHRGRGRVTTHGFSQDAIDGIADPRMVADESRAMPETVRLELASLKSESRDLLELAFVHGKTSRQIASATGMNINAVKTRMHRALVRLRLAAPKEYAAVA